MRHDDSEYAEYVWGHHRIYLRIVKRAQVLLELEKVGTGGHALAMQLLGNQDDAADVLLEDTLVSVLGSQSFDPARGSFKS